MSLPVILRPEAEADLAEARDWYERKLEGLGARFIAAADKFFEGITSFPEIYGIVMRTVRRGKLHKFPYVVYYRVLPDKIEILGVFHGSRDPKTWRTRIRSI